MRRPTVFFGIGAAVLAAAVIPAWGAGLVDRPPTTASDTSPAPLAASLAQSDAVLTGTSDTDTAPGDTGPTDSTLADRPADRPSDVGPDASDVRPADRRGDRHEELRFACEPTHRDERRAIACKWSQAQHPRAGGYRLWRAVDPGSGEPRAVIFRTSNLEKTSHVDSHVRPGHTYAYAVEAVDANGRSVGWGGPARVTLHHDLEALKLACDGHVRSDTPVITCEWSPSESRAFAGYLLVRSDGDRRDVVFRTRQRRETTFHDTEIRPNRRYTYQVQAIAEDGRVIGKSRPATAGVAVDDRLELGCALGSDGDHRGVACRWSAAEHPKAVGYVLYRSVDGGTRKAVYRGGLDGTKHFDTEVRPGHRYAYGVVAVAEDGTVVGTSNAVHVRYPAPSDTRPDVTTDARSVDRG